MLCQERNVMYTNQEYFTKFSQKEIEKFQMYQDIGKTFQGKIVLYEITWCLMCKTELIVCKLCKASSCSGGGCDECYDDYVTFQSVALYDTDGLKPNK